MSLVKIAAVAAAVMALGAVAPAQANHYGFSYDFGDGNTVAGDFYGNEAGQYVTGVTNVDLTINGIDVGPVDVLGYYGQSSYAVSYDRNLNDFWFADSSRPVNADGNFGFAVLGDDVHNPYADFYGNDIAWILDVAQGISSPFPGFAMNDSWSLAVVPEPATLAILGLGLAGLGFARRRR